MTRRLGRRSAESIGAKCAAHFPRGTAPLDLGHRRRLTRRSLKWPIVAYDIVEYLREVDEALVEQAGAALCLNM